MKRRYNQLLNEHLNEQDLSPLTPSEVSAQIDDQDIVTAQQFLHDVLHDQDILTAQLADTRARLDEALDRLAWWQCVHQLNMNCAAALHDSTCWCNRRIAFLSSLPGSADAKGTR